MKRLLFLLLGCIPFLSTAQTLSDAQKQTALQCATQFCDLLVRYCNGERLLISQINALCSGEDISAYDDVNRNDETSLMNYMLGIQHKYPDELPTSISTLSLSKSKTYIEPIMSLDYQWGNIGSSEMSTAEIGTLSVTDVENVYVAFDVTQTYPSLGISTNKKVVYDVKEGKITAFITGNGTLFSFLKGLQAFAERQYGAAITLFDTAAQNERAAFKEKSYALAMVCSLYSLDLKRTVHYAELIGDPLYINVAKYTMYIQEEDIENACLCALQLEKLMDTRKDLSNAIKTQLYSIFATVYLNPSSPYQDIAKGLSYLEEAHALGQAQAGYQIFIYYTLLGNNFVQPEVAMEYLYRSAERGYPTAFYQVAWRIEYNVEDKEEALFWYEKSALTDNHIAMASLGKLLIEKGEKAKGTEWLKKSLEGQGLEADLEDNALTTGQLAPWPQSRTDVETLLTRQNETNIHSNQSSTTNTTTNHRPAYDASSTPTIADTQSNKRHTRYRGEFNKAKDNYFVGFSIGYVQKQWCYDFDGTKEKINVFGDGKYTNGIQVGLRVDPQFKYGFGINTGLYYEYYFDKSKDMYEEGIEYHYRSEEHSLYLPVHLKYSLNFSKWFQLAFYAGIGLDCGVSGQMYLRSDGETLNSQTLYDDALDMKRFNASLEYGAAIRTSRFQLGFTMSKGLINMSGYDDYEVKQDKPINISLSVYI